MDFKGQTGPCLLTHWAWDKMNAIFQTTFSNGFSRMKMYEFWLKLKFVHEGSINNIPALVLTMAWRWPGDKPLSGPMMVRLPTHICVTRPQWVNREDLNLHHLCIWNVNMFFLWFLHKLQQKQNDCHFEDDILKFIHVWKFKILTKILLEFLPEVLFHNKPMSDGIFTFWIFWPPGY